ncbi:MAG: nuclear transport factor 2 family protein [Polyangiaceae bacterium]
MRARLLLGGSLVLLTACASAPPVPPRFETAPCPEVKPAAEGEAVIAGFYEAFSRRDFRGMACSYDPSIEFTDSIFGTLRGKRALAMWAMLTSSGTDLTVQASQIRADGAEGHAHWDAEYTFPFLVFRNHVDNHIDATFELRDGKIIRHTDVFDLQRWMGLALWPLGGVISEDTIRGSVQERLDKFIAEHPEFQDAPVPAAPAAP